MIHDAEIIARRVLRMVKNQEVETIDGKILNLKIDTICLHGDNENALNVIEEIRKTLDRENIKIIPLGKWIK